MKVYRPDLSPDEIVIVLSKDEARLVKSLLHAGRRNMNPDTHPYNGENLTNNATRQMFKTFSNTLIGKMSNQGVLDTSVPPRIENV